MEMYSSIKIDQSIRLIGRQKETLLLSVSICLPNYLGLGFPISQLFCIAIPYFNPVFEISTATYTDGIYQTDIYELSTLFGPISISLMMQPTLN